MQSGWLEQFMRKEPKAADPNRDDGVSRREFIHSGLATGVAAGMVAGGAVSPLQIAQAQQTGGSQETPLGPKWWPSRWGPQDEAAASNWITPAKVVYVFSPLRMKGATGSPGRPIAIV